MPGEEEHLGPELAAPAPVHDALDLTGPDLSTHHLMTLTTRLDALVRKAEKVISEIHRLNEQSGAALQRVFTGQAESVTALSDTVGSATADVTGLLDDVMTSLAETREVMHRNEGLVQKLVEGLHDASDHFTEIIEAADGPVGQLIDPKRITAQLEEALTPLMTELEQSRSLLREAARRSQRGQLNPAKLREQLGNAVGELATELRAEIETLAAELHEDRALLTKRVAAKRDVDQLRQLLELRSPEAPGPELAEELRGEIENVIAGLREEAAGIARRLSSNTRELEALRTEVNDVVSAVGSDLRRDTETLVGELHDDLALLMKQLITTTQELETLREVVERPPPAPSAEAVEHARDAIEAAAVEIRTGVERTVTELHDDLGVLLRRMADNQQEFDELRQAIAALELPTVAPVPSAETGEVRDLVTEVHADLAVVARQLGAARENLEQLRAEVVPDDERTAARLEELRGDLLAGLGAVASDLREEIDSLRGLLDREPPSPAPGIEPGAIKAEVDGSVMELRDDLAVMMSQVVASQDLVEALRADVAQQLAANAESLDGEVKGEFERLRRLLMRQRDEQRNAPGPDFTEVTDHVSATVAGATREVRDDVNLVVEQAAAVQQDLAGLRGRLDDIASTSATAAEGSPQLGMLVELINGLTDDVATVVRGLGGLQVEVGELQAAMAEPTPMPDVAGEVAAATEPVHDDLALLARQLGGLREELGGIQAAVGAATDVAGEVNAVVEQHTSPLQDDLSVLVRQVVALSEDLGEARAQLAELAAVPPLHDDVSVVARQLAAASEEIAELRRDVAEAAANAPDVGGEMGAVAASLHDDLALLFGEVTSTRTELAEVSAAIADIPVPDVATEVAAASAPVQEDLSAVVRQVSRALEELNEVRSAVAGLAAASEVTQIEATVQEGLGVVVGEVAAAREELGQVRAELASVAETAAPFESDPDLSPYLGPIEQDLSALVRQVAGAREELDELRSLAAEAAPPPDVRPDLADVRDDVGLVLRQVGDAQQELGALRAELADAVNTLSEAMAPVEIEEEPIDAGIDVAELPALFAEEVRVELQAVAAELRSDLDQLRRRLGPAPKERTRPEPVATPNDVRNEVAAGVAEISARVREELETAVAGLHDDVTNLMHEVVVGQEAVAALAATEAPAGAEGLLDPAVLAQEIRAEVTETVAALTTDLRSEIETMVNDLHDDIAIVLRQVVSTQEELTELRLQMAEAGGPAPAVDQMQAELDRLTQELETLRGRIPASAARPRPRSPRARR